MSLERFVTCAAGICEAIRAVATPDEQMRWSGVWTCEACQEVARQRARRTQRGPRKPRTAWPGAIAPAPAARVPRHASPRPRACVLDVAAVSLGEVVAYARGREEGFAAGYRLREAELAAEALSPEPQALGHKNASVAA